MNLKFASNINVNEVPGSKFFQLFMR